MTRQICSKILTQAEIESLADAESEILGGELGCWFKSLYRQIRKLSAQTEQDFYRLKAEYACGAVTRRRAIDLYQRYLAREILVATQVMRMTMAASAARLGTAPVEGWDIERIVSVLDSLPESIYGCKLGSGLWGSRADAIGALKVENSVVEQQGLDTTQLHHILPQGGRCRGGAIDAALFGINIHRFCVSLEASRHQALHRQAYCGFDYVQYSRAVFMSAEAAKSQAQYLRGVAVLCIYSGIDTEPPTDYPHRVDRKTGTVSPKRESGECRKQIVKAMVSSFG
jgi:hypothetical protein